MNEIQIGWVDLAMAGVMLLSLLVGLWRGLVFELMGLAGWVVAYVLAQLWTPEMSQYVRVGEPGSALHHGSAFVACFVLVLIVWSLLARLVRLLVRATPLTGVDRAFGGVFGLLRGLLVLLVAATLVSFTPVARSKPWTESRGAGWLNTALHGLKPVLPPEVGQHLPG